MAGVYVGNTTIVPYIGDVQAASMWVGDTKIWPTFIDQGMQLASDFKVSKQKTFEQVTGFTSKSGWDDSARDGDTITVPPGTYTITISTEWAASISGISKQEYGYSINGTLHESVDVSGSATPNVKSHQWTGTLTSESEIGMMIRVNSTAKSYRLLAGTDTHMTIEAA